MHCCRFRKRKRDEARALSRACSDFAHFKMAASSDDTLSASAAASPSTAQRKPRKHFRIGEDLCLLKEVACVDPFGNPAAWEDMLQNVVKAVHHELTIRGIKERADLLVGYFRQQDTANLRKSSTGEQYGELEQLLQDISDLMREADYVPKTVPWRGNGIAPWWTVGFLTSAKALCK